MTFDKFIGEIQNSGFNLKRKLYRTPIHDEKLVRGNIFIFRKAGFRKKKEKKQNC